MRLIERRDAPVVIGLIAGTAVMFGQPLRFVLSIAEDLSQRYQIDLVPGLFIFVLACAMNYWRKHRDAVVSAQVQAREAQDALKTAADLEKLVAASHSVANAVDVESLRAQAWRHVPALLKERQSALAMCGSSGWQWVLEPTGDAETLLDLAPLLYDLGAAGEGHHGRWLIIPLRGAERQLGILIIDETVPLSIAEKGHAQMLGSVMSIAIKNLQLFADMQASSTTDALTGCFNRGHGFETLANELRRSRRSKSPLAVIMLDVDGFKGVNDESGHLTGDRLLEGIGETLRRTLRTSDVKCRYGGDEFLVILPDTPADAARLVGENIRRAVSRLQVVGPKGRVACQISVGVAGASLDETDPREVIQRADEALYDDKLQRARHRAERSEAPADAAPSRVDSSLDALSA